MTPKEKAKELVKKYEDFTTIWIDEDNFYKSPKLAKKGALIAVDELIEQERKTDDYYEIGSYWNKVKKEIWRIT